MTLSVDRSSCPFLIRHDYCRYFLWGKKNKNRMEMERLVRCVSTLVYVCVCPLGLLGVGSSSVLLFLSAAWDPSCSVCPGWDCWARRREATVMTHSITPYIRRQWTLDTKRLLGSTNSLNKQSQTLEQQDDGGSGRADDSGVLTVCLMGHDPGMKLHSSHKMFSQLFKMTRYDRNNVLMQSRNNN